MIRYQVNRCNEIGFKLLLMITLLLVTWQALTPHLPNQPEIINDKLGHALVFLLLAAISDHAYASSAFAVKKISYLLVYGIAIECIQYYIPGRMFSLLDIGADLGGLLLYLLITRFIFIRQPSPVPIKK
jgi:VanZ family protein